MPANEWSIRYGASRKALDKKLIAEVERQIEAEEKAAKAASIPGAVNPATHSRATVSGSIDHDARAAIAKAFGRPLR